MKILGVITARGGSKGIPGKNIKPLLGKPLIAYTIEAAQASGVFDRLILSTDDEEIAKVARAYGCEVPFVRPKELAEDTTAHLPVMQHAVKWMEEHEHYVPDYVMILLPTSPLRQAFHIRGAMELMAKGGVDSVLSVAEIPVHYSPLKAMVLDEGGMLKLFNGNPVKRRVARRQDQPKAYWSTTAIYLFKTALLFDREEPNFYGDKVAPYVMEEKYVVDIDVPEDWVEAERALERLTEQKKT